LTVPSLFRFQVPFNKQALPYDELQNPERLRGKKVLVMDDNATIRLVVNQMLMAWGCIADEAESIEESMNKIADAVNLNEPFHVMIMGSPPQIKDVQSVIGQMKARPDLAKIPIILLIPLGFARDVEDIMATGIASFIMKPVKRTVLRDRLLTTIGAPNSRTFDVSSQSAIPLHGLARAGKVLLVEDNVTNQLVGMALLKRLGHHVDVAANGFEAIAALRNIPYDMVLMDCQMPEMDGFEATARIRSGEAGLKMQPVPIIAMTARAVQGDREKCIQAGMDDYLPKPVNANALVNILNRYFSGRIAEPPVSVQQEEETARTDEPVLEIEALRESLDSNEKLMTDLINIFLIDTAQRIKSLMEALEKGNTTDAAGQAHSIKGASATLHAARIRDISKRIEISCRSGDNARQILTSLFPTLEKEFKDLDSFVKRARHL
jgi:two-component system, sensor histidine kinase and response regulator